MKKLFKNQWSNIIFGVLILILIIPQTRKPVQIFVNKILSFSPSVTEEEDREQLADYNWVLENTNGKRVNFADSKGEVILVNYWATWCPPCIAEMPSLQKLYSKYEGKMDFYFVSGEDHETTSNFMKRKGYSMPSYRMLSADPKPMDGYTLPTTYLIDKKGNIVIHKVGAADWNSERTRSIINSLLMEE
ncbi:TlpA family protein disulfide reductase [Salegentibacter chungangensis]|uniref:TlpA family protein disulfide reductase n=1 Tax=Salegentibacter chungangensis TaxID=1335724 RepID=A0ABW3NV64_9FLAO